MLTRPWFTEEEVAAFNRITRTSPYCTSRVNATNPPHGASAHPWHLREGIPVIREVDHVIRGLHRFGPRGDEGVIQQPGVAVERRNLLHRDIAADVDRVLMQVGQHGVEVCDRVEQFVSVHAGTVASTAQSQNWNPREDFHAAEG